MVSTSLHEINAELTLHFQCPIPAGTYHINGFVPDASGFPPVLRSGDYMKKITYLKDDEVMQVVNYYVHMSNKVGGKIGL